MRVNGVKPLSCHDINIRNQTYEQLNRTSDIAELRPQGAPLTEVPLPTLLDTRVVRNGDQRFHDERPRGNRRLPVCAVVVVQGGVTVFARQNAGDGWANSSANLSGKCGVQRGILGAGPLNSQADPPVAPV